MAEIELSETEKIGQIDSRLGVLESVAIGGGSAPYATWSDLLAVTPTALRQRAEVIPTDTGEHIDPQTSATVPNSGVFGAVSVSSVLVWHRVYDYGAVTEEEVEGWVEPFSDLAEAWAQSATAPDPDDPTSKSAKTLAAEAQEVLDDPGVAAVAADLLGANKIGVVAGGITQVTAVGNDLGLGATSKVIKVATDLLLGATSKIAAVAADLLSGASNIVAVGTDLLLGAGSFILRAPAAAISATASQVAAAASAVLAATNAALAGTRIVSGLAQYGTTDKRVAFGILDTANRVGFGITQAGQVILDIDPDCRAYTMIRSQAAAAVGNVGISNISGNNMRVGDSGKGSPNTGRPLVELKLDTNKRLAYGVEDDGTFAIGKYDIKIKSATDGAMRLANGPVPILDTGNVVLLYGTGRRTIWASGTASNVRFGTAGNFVFTDKLKGLDLGLSVTVDGTVRAVQRDTTYDIYTGAGSSALCGAYVPATGDTIPIYPGRTLSLTDRPILVDAATRSGAAVLIDLAEVSLGSFASYFAASMYAKASPYRPTIKIAVVGHGVNGSTTTASLDVGSTAGNDIIASVARIVALSGVAAGPNGACRVVGHILHHGDAVINASYAANLAAYQASFEAGIQTATGQIERVPFFCSCSATQQKFAAGGTPVANYNGYLATAAITRTVADGGNANFFPTVADYILTYTDNQHPASGMTGQDLRAEYEAVAVDTVINQGRDFVAARVSLPAAWTITSTYIDIPCEVQVAPLLVDTLLCTDPGTDSGAIDANGKGFTLTDSNSRRITGVTVVGGGTTLRLAISGALGTGRSLEYAATNGTSGLSGRAGGPRGCVHDSSAVMSRDGTTRLYNPLWPFVFAF